MMSKIRSLRETYSGEIRALAFGSEMAATGGRGVPFSAFS